MKLNFSLRTAIYVLSLFPTVMSLQAFNRASFIVQKGFKLNLSSNFNSNFKSNFRSAARVGGICMNPGVSPDSQRSALFRSFGEIYVCFFACLFVCVFVCLSVCLFVYLSVCLCLSACLSICTSVYSLSQSIFLASNNLKDFGEVLGEEGDKKIKKEKPRRSRPESGPG
jgi:hypothetical protein